MDHHITPQFLLRPWALGDEDSKLHVYRYRDARLSQRRLAPKGTSYEPDLYALTRDQVIGHDRQSVETKMFQDLDTAAALVRAKMARNERLTREDMMTWTRFLIGLRARQPQTVEHLRLNIPDLVRGHLAERPEEFDAIAKGSAPSLEAWTEKAFPGLIENFGLLMLGDVTTHAPLADKIIRLKWLTRRFPRPADALLLSDNPEFVGSTIDKPDFVIALPISPRQAFFAVSNEEAALKTANAPAEQLAQRLNVQSIRLASEKVYACNWDTEAFVRDHLAVLGEINRMSFGSVA